MGINKIKKPFLKFLMLCLALNFAPAQRDSTTYHTKSFLVSGGMSLNTFWSNNQFKIAQKSPVSGYIEIGVLQKISSAHFLYFSLNYQPFILNNYYKEFYDKQNWTSVGITASYLFHKLNFIAGINYQHRKIIFGGSIGISYTFESKFQLKNFGCAYPYGSTQYQNVRNYYYTAFNKDNEGVIIYKVLAPLAYLNVMYEISPGLKLRADLKYELSTLPAYNDDWSLFRISPVSLGLIYCLK